MNVSICDVELTNACCIVRHSARTTVWTKSADFQYYGRKGTSLCAQVSGLNNDEFLAVDCRRCDQNMSWSESHAEDDSRSNGRNTVCSLPVFVFDVCSTLHRSLTNDGNAILREIEVAHPAAKNMIELSRTQDEECGDGTTSVIILGKCTSAIIAGFL